MMHHRRFASGFRACEVEGPRTSRKDPETQDVSKVTCLACLDDLRRRCLLPARPAP